MAIMYPKNIELYDATLSERKVYKALQEQLPETYTVFYSVQWVDQINGKKSQSESDFLIFSEQDGFLTCEVKGGVGYKKVGDQYILEDRDGQRLLRCSPMEQAEESARYFEKLYSTEYNDKFNGVYGSISVFPFYSVDDPVLLDHRTKDVVIDIKDMSNLSNRIKQAFMFYKSNRYFVGPLTKNQKDNFKNLINRSIAAQASAGAIVEAKEFELVSVNRIQNNFIEFLVNYNKSFISGGAGTGKTWIAYKFAIRNALEGKRVLLTTLNKPLIKMLQKKLSIYQNVRVLNFTDILLEDGVDEDVESVALIDKYMGKVYKKYDSIIVDEAQDFDQYEARVISLHLKDQYSELRVFYDQTQNILEKDFKDGFDINYPTFVLKENLRNTSSIYNWASDKTNLGKEVITNQIIGPMPISYQFKNEYELIKQLESELINLVDKEMVPINSIVILFTPECRARLKVNSIARWELVENMEPKENEILISTVDNFKGLESNVVFYIHELHIPDKYNYVAYTRAKYYLFEYVLTN